MNPRSVPRQRPRRARPFVSLMALVVAMPMLSAAALPESDATPVADREPGAAAQQPSLTTLTLVTGDRVQLEHSPDGQPSATVDPAAGREHVSFQTTESDGDLYIIPSDTAGLLPDVLDRELFNVTKLAEYEYTGRVPVIVTQPESAARPAAALSAAADGLSVTTDLPSVHGFAATIGADGSWWRDLSSGAGVEGLAAAPHAGKVWLDEIAEIALDGSVPLVGAPQAWADGFDGTGIQVAVLDTGIDDQHPDLAGKVVEQQNFTTEPDAGDNNGHGSHVASTVAGTGAASDGRFTGVAPGAELLNGKICTASGSCPTSGTLEAMEWAAGRADVVSMSIGTNRGSDGTDPMAQAVNTLSAAHDVLFVISAGNNGTQGPGSIGSPGAADAALTVGSVDKAGRLAATSSRGPRLGDGAIKPEITAPGVAIVAARGEGTSLGAPVNEFYTTLSGTSMAAPHVSGAAAIALQKEPELGAQEVKATLASTGTQTGPLAGEITSGPHAGASYQLSPAVGSGPIEGPITGNPTFVGYGCQQPGAGTGIALIERGPAADPCTFQQKLDNVAAAGFEAGLVFNQPGSGCNSHVLMDASGDIPFVFVSRLAGLQLLQRSDVTSGSACTTDAPDPGAEVASTEIVPGAQGIYTVYEQGGGRLTVPAALDSPVRPAPPVLDIGLFEFPQDNADPVSTEVTYTNRTDAPVTVELSVDATNEDGVAAPSEMLSVSPASQVVQPGETVTTAVIVDPRFGEFGRYGGYLAATVGGEVVTRTALGYHKETEHYNLTVQGFDRNGNPIDCVCSDFTIVDVFDADDFVLANNTFANGTRTIRVPASTYIVAGDLTTLDGSRNYPNSKTLAVQPEVTVTEDTTVVLDARDGMPLEVETPAHPEAVQAGNRGFAVYREGVNSGDWQMSVTFSGTPLFATPTEPVTLGSFDSWTRSRLRVAPIAVSVVAPTAQQLTPYLMRKSPHHTIDQETPLIWVGAGGPADYQGLDVNGAVVLTQRGLGSFPSNKILEAAAHGAVALIEMNSASGFHTGFAGNDAPIPAATISLEEGLALRGLLDQGEVTVHLQQTPRSPFLYDLINIEPDRIPDQLQYVAEPDQLAAVTYDHHSTTPDQVGAEVRHFWRPWTAISTGISEEIPLPQVRTDYIRPSEHTGYRQVLWAELPFNGRLGEVMQVYQPGEELVNSFFRSPIVPGTQESGRFEGVDLGDPTRRDGDVLSVRGREWVDAGGNRYIPDSVDDLDFRLYQNGTLIGTASRMLGDFSVTSAPAEHRLELDVVREADWWDVSTETHTAWTLQSPGTTSGPVPVPLLIASYQADGLDLTNTASGKKGVRSVVLDVDHQPWVVDGPPVAEVRAWVSYDDGASWEEQRVRPRPDGTFLARLKKAPKNAEFASFRIEATDQDGNAIEQEVIRAWHLPAG